MKDLVFQIIKIPSFGAYFKPRRVGNNDGHCKGMNTKLEWW